MTSITHATSSSTALTARRAHATPKADRLHFGADSKAVRVGLGVVIAAVMAGDVFAVLRSPASERTSSAGRPSAASLTDEAGAAGGGFVATSPFSEAAFDDALTSRLDAVARDGVRGAGAAAAVAPVAPALVAPVLATPAIAPAPVAPVTSFVPPVAPPAPAVTGTTTQDTPPPPAESPLAPIVELVPQAAPVVAIVEDVVAAVPVDSAPASVAEVNDPAAVAPPALPSGLSL